MQLPVTDTWFPSSVLEYWYKLNTKLAFSVGFDAFIDPSARDTVEYAANKQAQETFFRDVDVGYEFIIWRLAIRMQVGTYLTGIARELKGDTFIRPALRYNINDRHFAQIGLKTMNGSTADWVECGIGYQFPLRK